MAAKLKLVVCRHYVADVRAALAASDAGDVVVTSHADLCTHPQPADAGVLADLASPPNEREDVLFFGGCFLQGQSPPPAVSPQRVHRAEHCLQLVVPKALQEHFARQGAYLVTPGWLAEWPGHLKRWGFDASTAREFFRECARRVVLFDTGTQADAEEWLGEFGLHVGLPVEVVPVGLDLLEQNVHTVVSEWRLNNARSRAADHAMALDLLWRFGRIMTEAEAVEAIVDLGHMLFASHTVRFVTAGNEPAPYLPEGRDWLELPSGFALRVVHGGQTLGTLVIDDVALPDRLTEYLNLALEVVGLFGLAISNARAMQRIQATELALRAAKESAEAATVSKGLVLKELERHREHLEELIAVRVKEQSCLFLVSRILSEPFDSLLAVMREAVDVVPSGMQHSDCTCARLTVRELSVTTGSFRESPLRLAADVVVAGESCGSVEVFCLEDRGAGGDGAFLPEEKDLLATFARMLGQMIERKESEERLRRSEEKFAKAFKASPYGIAITRLEDGSYVEVNDALSVIIGFTREETLAGSSLELKVWVDEAARQHAIDDLRAGRAVVGRETPFRKKTGEIITCSLSAQLLGLGRDSMMLSCIEDITVRKQAEEEKRRLQEQMVQSQRLESIGTLASGVAHEINNPLNIVMNFAQLILDEQGTSSAAREFATHIVNESARMATIVRNLLTFSRHEKHQHSPAEVATIVTTTLSLVRASFRKDQIELITEIEDGLPMIRCRSQQIQQVLMNLLTNARDALNARFPGASPDKLIRVVARAFEREGTPRIRLTVEDKGGGLAPEVAGHVFEPFFTTKSKDKGTGLGLSISHRIVKEHRGELWFENEVGVGTRFHVDLQVDNGWSSSQRVTTDTPSEV